MPAQTTGKKGGKNRKFGRNALACKVYRDSCREDRNRKRAMQRHLRRNPGDEVAVKRYEQTYGKAADIGLASKGAALEQRYIKEAQLKARRK